MFRMFRMFRNDNLNELKTVRRKEGWKNKEAENENVRKRKKN